MEMLRRATFRAVNTIGIPSLVALLLGVPAMIGFVTQIWGAISQPQRSIAVACMVLVIIAIGIFVYGQTKRELMVIPKLIYRMSERANEITSKITLHSDSEELTQFLSLVGLVGHSFEKITDYETFRTKAPMLIKEAQSQANRIKKDPKQSARVVRFIHEGYVRKILDNDDEYQRLKKRLLTKWPIIPTTELSANIITYNKLAVVKCSCVLMLTTKDPRILEVVPMADLLDAKIEMDVLDEKLSMMLAKVNQSIDQYYAGNLRKGENEKGR